MNFKRTIAKTMIFAMALSVMPLVNPGTVRAEAPNQITFDGEAETLTTNATYWGVAKIVAENKANLKISDANYLIDTIEPVVDGKIDLSFLKKNKSVVIALGSSATVGTTDWIVKKIEPQDKDVKVLYITDSASAEQHKIGNGEGGYLAIKKGEVAVELPNVSEEYMIKKGKSSWKTLKAYFGDNLDATKVGDKLAVLTQKGAEIKIKKKGTENAWSSKEVKVKIAAKAKAPNVKIDPDKGTVSLKKGMDYVIPASGSSTIAESDNWTSLGEAGKKTLKDLNLDGIDSTKHLLVRTSASAKKLASKITDITVIGQAAPTEGKQNATAIGGTVLTGVEVKTKVPYDISKGAIISNDTDKDYEFYIAAQKIDNPKWTKLKAKTTKKGKKVVPTTVALKYSKEAKDYAYTSDNAATKLYIRLAGKKQKNNVVTLASTATEINLPLKNVDQAVELTGTASVVPSGNYPKSKVTISGAKANATYKVAVKVTQIYSEKGATLKTKVTEKASGVSVKGGKFKLHSDKSYGTAELEIKTAKSFLKKKDESAAKVTVVYTVEGVKGEVEITLNK